jgi:putative spermidine/putrescine transport system substrate-binding protein
MNWHRFHRLGLAAATVLVVAACGSSSTAGSTDWSKQASASAGGGIDALATAAKAEGKLTVIALPPDWANYGAIISAFESKYGIKVTSLNPNGSSQEEVDAFDGTALSRRD